VDVISLSVAFREIQGAGFILKRIAGLKAAIGQHANMVLCKTVDDILQAKSEKKIALILNFQETLPFEDDVNLIQVFYELGVRHALLAYNIQNHVGGGCAESTDGGLTRFGRKVVREMNRVGMIVDGSHSGYKTTMEAMEMCEGPFIFSHANAHTLFPHYRNIKDDQIKACARSGGVIGINGVGEFMDDVDATSESMFRHADYIVQLVGPEHIGIGLDFVLDYEKFWRSIMPETDKWPALAGRTRVVTRYARPEQLVEVAELMFKRGYKENDVKGFLGENFLRVARQVWN
jgi:membrane dipeptidase